MCTVEKIVGQKVFVQNADKIRWKLVGWLVEWADLTRKKINAENSENVDCCPRFKVEQTQRGAFCCLDW